MPTWRAVLMSMGLAFIPNVLVSRTSSKANFGIILIDLCSLTVFQENRFKNRIIIPLLMFFAEKRPAVKSLAFSFEF
jgi:hypothetical protein